jgi:hypothetical protein
MPFTMKNTDGFTQSELNTLNAAAWIVREQYDCDGLEQYIIEDAIGQSSCLVEMISWRLADKASERLKLTPR